ARRSTSSMEQRSCFTASGHATLITASQSEISKRRTSESPLEHERECGGIFVAEIHRDGRDGLARREPRQRADQTSLLTPFHEAEASLASEQARERAAAHVQIRRPAVDRFVDRRLANELAAARRQSAFG